MKITYHVTLKNKRGHAREGGRTCHATLILEGIDVPLDYDSEPGHRRTQAQTVGQLIDCIMVGRVDVLTATRDENLPMGLALRV